jgi:predicted DNA binding CopG/RHH family protein
MTTDNEAFAYYSDPEHHKPGKRVARGQKPMKGHVPVRFSDEAIASVKAIADHDGVTVSTWIRQVVMKEVERRQPSVSVPSPAWATTVDWQEGPNLVSSSSVGYQPSS